MPHQSQGACMALEDAAALGILFSPKYFDGNVQSALTIYDEIRLPRATRVQQAAAKAAYNINERIGKLWVLRGGLVANNEYRVFEQQNDVDLQGGRWKAKTNDWGNERVRIP